MRTIYLAILLAIPALCFSQLDSSIKYQTPDIKLRYYSPAVNDTLEISNVNTIVLKGDEVMTQSGKFKVGQLSSITIQTGKGKFSDGILPGALGGLVTGIIVGSMLDVDDEFNHGGYFFNIKYALVTIPVGAIVGAVIGGLVSSELPTRAEFETPGTNAVFKKSELLRLMELYGERK